MFAFKTGTPLFVLTLLVLSAALPETAQAYVGPGAGLTAIGTVLALIGAVVLALVGFVWYPIKRLVSGRRKPKDEVDPPA